MTSCPILEYPDPAATTITCLADPRAIWIFGEVIPPDSTAEWLIFGVPAFLWLALVLSSSIISLLASPNRFSSLLRRVLSHQCHRLLVDIANNAVVQAMDVRRTHQELWASRDSRLGALDYFRVAAMTWVMANHLGSEGRIDVLERRESAAGYKEAIHGNVLLGPLFGNSALGVEVFLVLGMILGIGSSSKLQGSMARRTMHYISKRSIRLWLTSAAFILIVLSPHFRSILPRFSGTMTTACGWKGLLAHLSFTGNLQVVPTCLGYLWYLGLDFQLQLFVPYLANLLTGSPGQRKAGFFVVLAGVVGSMILRGLWCIAHGTCNKSDVDIPFIHIASLTEREMEGMYDGLWRKYALPPFKVGPFLLAAILGVKVHDGEEISLRKSRALFWSGLAGSIAVVYGILPEYWYPLMPANAYNVTYTASFRTAFSFCVLSMISSFVLLPTPRPVWKWASFLARICFSAYLVHMPAAYVFNWWPAFQETESALFLLVIVLPLHIVLTFSIAYVFYLTIEGPLARLGGIFLKGIEERLTALADGIEDVFSLFGIVIQIAWYAVKEALI